MSSGENYINYDVVLECAGKFEQGAEAIAQTAADLSRCNDKLVNDGWRNDTARAYKQRYEEEHKKALQGVETAMREVATFLRNYVQNKSEGDSTEASHL